MDEQILKQAITHIKNGDKSSGRKLLLQLLKDNPRHETALLWLSTTTNDLEQKRKCFEQVLKINPNNEKAKQALAKLEPVDDMPDLEDMVSSTKVNKLPQTRGERTYHKDNAVTITSTRAVLKNSSYPMTNIASVSTKVIPAKNTLGIILILFGILGVVCALFGKSAIIWMGTATILFVGILIVATARKQYAVRIGTSSGETNALTSADKDYIDKIVRAINQAIIDRG